jgi:hypothetical protein
VTAKTPDPNARAKRAIAKHVETYRATAPPANRKPSIDKRKPKPPTESQEQVNVVEWMALMFPHVKFMAIPNGGNRNVITARRLKREGASAGVPDLFFPEWHLWIEMKRTEGGVISAEQRAWHVHLRRIGYTVLECKGAEIAKRAICQHIVMMDEMASRRK